MNSNTPTTLLHRPVGPKELELLRASGMKLFPPRLREQPIFYPVLNEEYATQIERDWNVPDSGAGHVTRFAVRSGYLTSFAVQTVGSRVHQELGVPSEELDEFNRNIVGEVEIEVVASFGKETP